MCFTPVEVLGDGTQAPMAYRYTISPDVKINAYKPKPLTTEDKLTLRSAQFGALWSGRFNQLPRTLYSDIVWEAWELAKKQK